MDKGKSFMFAFNTVSEPLPGGGEGKGVIALFQSHLKNPFQIMPEKGVLPIMS